MGAEVFKHFLWHSKEMTIGLQTIMDWLILIQKWGCCDGGICQSDEVPIEPKSVSVPQTAFLCQWSVRQIK